MSSIFVITLLLFFALSSSVMAGVYFAFSGFVMRAFDDIGASQAMAAMNSINDRILRSWFMPLFFGSAMLSVLMVIISIVYWAETSSIYLLIAGLVYFIGMFVCTVVFNVPLNDFLAKQHSGSDEAQQVWSHYLKNWTRWNHVRALCSLVTSTLCFWLLAVQ